MQELEKVREDRIAKYLADLTCDVLELNDQLRSKHKNIPNLEELEDREMEERVVEKATRIIEKHYAEKIAHAVIVRDKEMFDND